MASAEHTEIIKRGKYTWNQWRLDHPTASPDLRSGYFREADLRGYNFAQADFRAAMMLGADLRDADLRGADFSYADVRFVDFHDARLEGARFEETKGVAGNVVKAARGPNRWRGHLAKLALAAGVCAVLYLAYQGGVLRGEIDAWTVELSETADGWMEPDQVDASEAELTGGPVREVEQRLIEIEFSSWSIKAVRIVHRSMLIRTDQQRLDEDAYAPTLAAACGVLAGREDGWTPEAIHVVDEAERAGWTFESPENCRQLIRTPPAVMRLAIAAETKKYAPPTESP